MKQAQVKCRVWWGGYHLKVSLLIIFNESGFCVAYGRPDNTQCPCTSFHPSMGAGTEMSERVDHGPLEVQPRQFSHPVTSSMGNGTRGEDGVYPCFNIS